MILGEESSGWTVTEVDPLGDTSDGGSLQSTSVGGMADPGMPTGPVPVTTTPTASPVASTARVAGQTAVVLAAAVLVGVIVFLIVRAAVGSGSDDDAPEDFQDEAAVIDPGPSEDDAALEDSTRSGSRRSESADGWDADESEDVAEAAPAGPAAAAADADDGLTVSSGVDSDEQASTTSTQVAGNAVAEPGQSTSSAPPPTAADDQGLGASPPTTTGNNNTTTTAASLSPTVSATTATTAQTPTTSSATTTTTAVTTTTVAPVPTTPAPTVAPPSALIALPSDGDRRAWQTFTRFRANDIPTATKYCWLFVSGGGGQRQTCEADTVYDLPATPRGLLPGPLDVKAQAFAADGSLLAEDKLSIELLVTNLADEPDRGDNVDLNDDIRLRSEEVLSADRYCWTIIQGAVSTGEVCEGDRRARIDEGDARLEGFDSGAARVLFTAYRGDDLIGSEGRRIDFR